MAGFAARFFRSTVDTSREAVNRDVCNMLRLTDVHETCISKILSTDSWSMGCLNLPRMERAEPVQNENKTITVLLEGELLGCQSIRQQSEVLIRHYENQGISCIACLDGVFAGVIHDAAAKRIHVFTDRLGIGTAYYAALHNGFAAGSALRAFLALHDFPLKEHEQAIADIINYGVVSGDSTLLENVFLVPPAGIVTCDDAGTVSITRYWKPEYNDAPVDTRHIINDFQEAMLACMQRFQATVPEQARWGVTLSGGLDSRVISAMFKEQFNNPLTAVTYGRDGTCEYERARIVAKKLGIPHHLVEFHAADMLRGYPRAMWLTDCMGAVSDLYLAGQIDTLGSFMDMRLDGFLGDALWGGTYLNESIFNAGSFNDCWPWLWKKMGRGIRDDTVLAPSFRAALLQSRKTRIQDAWNSENITGAPRDMSEWILYLNRGRRYIHQHHTMPFLGLFKSIKPFMDYRCMELTWQVPAEERINYKIYMKWLQEFYPDMAAIPVADLSSSVRNMVRYTGYILHILSCGHFCIIDSKCVQSNGWAESITYKKNIISFLTEQRSLSRSYIDAGQFTRYLKKAKVLPHVFPFVSIFYQLEWFHRLFIERDRAALTMAGAPLDAVAEK